MSTRSGPNSGDPPARGFGAVDSVAIPVMNGKRNDLDFKMDLVLLRRKEWRSGSGGGGRTTPCITASETISRSSSSIRTSSPSTSSTTCTSVWVRPSPSSMADAKNYLHIIPLDIYESLSGDELDARSSKAGGIIDSRLELVENERTDGPVTESRIMFIEHLRLKGLHYKPEQIKNSYCRLNHSSSSSSAEAQRTAKLNSPWNTGGSCAVTAEWT